MTIGFIYNGSDYARPDKTLSRNISPAVLSARFGDGYEQRIPDGINTLKEEISLVFTNRPKAEIDDIKLFLDGTQSVTKFSLIVPDSNVTSASAPAGVGERELKVVADSYSITYSYGDFYSININCRRVFEA
jgi:phage-related protein